MIRFLFVFCLVLGFSNLRGQSSIPNADSTQKVTANVQQSVKKKSVEVLDTKESLKYMGDVLFFQIKRRLHLTSKEEEIEAAEKEKETVNLSIGGIIIERN